MRLGNLGLGSRGELSKAAHRRASAFLFLNSWNLDGRGLFGGGWISRLVMTSVWIMGSREYLCARDSLGRNSYRVS